jgi:hypothetical protein
MQQHPTQAMQQSNLFNYTNVIPPSAGTQYYDNNVQQHDPMFNSQIIKQSAAIVDMLYSMQGTSTSIEHQLVSSNQRSMITDNQPTSSISHNFHPSVMQHQPYGTVPVAYTLPASKLESVNFPHHVLPSASHYQLLANQGSFNAFNYGCTYSQVPTIATPSSGIQMYGTSQSLVDPQYQLPHNMRGSFVSNAQPSSFNMNMTNS